MLIKITNYCSMGCSHCMEDSTIAGHHMTRETFLAALDFTRRVEESCWKMGVPPQILLSGGECTEHPDFLWFLEEVERQALRPVLISNGSWLHDKTLRAAILRSDRPGRLVQVTYDARYYPKAPPVVSDPRLCYVDSLTSLIPLGRLARKKGPHALPMKRAPGSFNFRALTRHYRSFTMAVVYLRLRAHSGSWGNCTPSVSENGDVLAGETRFCFKVGTVHSSEEELTHNTLAMRCNACGLVNNLTPVEKAAIGESDS